MTVRDAPWPTLNALLPLLALITPPARLVAVPPKRSWTRSPAVPVWVIVPALVKVPTPALVVPMMTALWAAVIVAPALLSTEPPPVSWIALLPVPAVIVPKLITEEPVLSSWTVLALVEEMAPRLVSSQAAMVATTVLLRAALVTLTPGAISAVLPLWLSRLTPVVTSEVIFTSAAQPGAPDPSAAIARDEAQ